MTKRTNAKVVPVEGILPKILVFRGQKVLLDTDLAILYGVTTGNLNKAVKRNLARFPDDFMFRLDRSEAAVLRFQSGISNSTVAVAALCHMYSQNKASLCCPLS